MSTIILGVEAGAYAFDAAERTITVSGIPGLSLASFKLIQNLTTGRMLYVFDGAPATFAGGVLTLPASADLSGANDTDTLAIYVQEPAAARFSLTAEVTGSGNPLKDFTGWDRTAQVTFNAGYGTGPVFGYPSHRVRIAHSPDSQGIYQFTDVSGKTAGTRMRFAVFLRAVGTATAVKLDLIGYNAANDYSDHNSVVTPGSQWAMYEVTGVCSLADATKVQLRIRPYGEDVDVEVCCPQFTTGSDTRLAVPGSTAVVPLFNGEMPTFGLYGDSIIGGSNGGNFRDDLSRMFGGCPIYNGGVGGETSTQCADRVVAAGASGPKSAHIVGLCMGRNNAASYATVLADIARSVASLKHGRFFIMPVLNGSASNEASGQALYSNMKTDINAVLKAAYGSRFIEEIWTERNAGSATDQPRPEYLYDTVHPNAVGCGLIANSIHKLVRSFGWA
jgi:hypothetical protein